MIFFCGQSILLEKSDIRHHVIKEERRKDSLQFSKQISSEYFAAEAPPSARSAPHKFYSQISEERRKFLSGKGT